MLAQRFKLIFLPAGTSKKREFNFSRRLFYLCVGAFAFAFLLLSITTGFVLYETYSTHQLSSLNFRSEELNSQLRTANSKLEQLQGRVDVLALNGDDLRYSANLPLFDPGVQQMGIGGSLPYSESANVGAETLLAKIDEIDRQISLQEKSLIEISNQLEEQSQYLMSVPSIRPVVSGSISSLFGRRRDPFTGQWVPHMGLDFNAQTGTPVYAAADGKVIHIRREPAYGKTIVIDHGNGYKTRYAHLHRYYVSKGQKVKRNDPIGEVGNTGRSTGSHLHYEVIHNKQHLNPLDFMFDGYAMARMP